jgi:hypothetical protein
LRRIGRIDRRQRDLLAAVALARAAVALAIDEHFAHRARRDREEMRAILRARQHAVRELEVRLVHKLRRHQGLPAAAGELPSRDRAKLLVDKRQQARSGIAIAAPPLAEKLRDGKRFGHADTDVAGTDGGSRIATVAASPERPRLHSSGNDSHENAMTTQRSRARDPLLPRTDARDTARR